MREMPRDRKLSYLGREIRERRKGESSKWRDKGTTGEEERKGRRKVVPLHKRKRTEGYRVNIRIKPFFVPFEMKKKRV